jgi:tellurite resistance protein
MSSTLPRLAVKINSMSGNADQTDRFRIFLQAASIVRLANNTRASRDFVFVAIFISSDGQAERRLFFQSPEDSDEVSNQVHVVSLS